jgi:hypothetical protein
MRKLSTLLFTPIVAITLSMTVPTAQAQDTAGCHGRKGTKAPEGKPAVKTKERKGGKKISPEDAASKDAAKSKQ